MEKITTGRDESIACSPKFAKLNKDVLFGENWTREQQRSPRDRNLITGTA